jgi:hypothetical protein
MAAAQGVGVVAGLNERTGGDQNGVDDAGPSDGPTQAGAMPVEIRREWLVSLRFRIGGAGIMSCRS